VIALALCCGALVLLGCGGSSDPSSRRRTASTGSATSSRATVPKAAPSVAKAASKADERAQFIARADAICARVNRELSAVKKKGPKPILRVVPGNIVIERGALGELRALAAPASTATAWQQILDLRRIALQELLALVRATRHQQASSITKLIFSKKATHGKLLAAGQSSGFKDCARLG